MAWKENEFNLGLPQDEANSCFAEKLYFSDQFQTQYSQIFMNIQSVSDQRLLHMIREDDGRAFREIYQRYWKKLYLMARSKVADGEVVESMVQDIFLKIWERRSSLRIENLEAYLITSVKYACVNHLKATLVHERFVTHVFAGFHDSVCTADERLNADELMSNMEQRLKQFPEKAQQAFRAHRLENKSTREISFEMNMPQRTVEHHIQLVVKALRAHLKDYF